MSSAGGHITWNNGEKQGLSSVLPERKISRNIGSKSKRLQIDSQEVVELKLTWEEVQDMLRASDVAKPNIVTVEDYEIEEYEASEFMFISEECLNYTEI